MNISSISDIYTKTITENAQAAKAASTIDKASLKAGGNDDELLEACKSFESYFLEQCFKEMWKSVDLVQSDSPATNTMMDYYKDSMISEMANQSTQQNSLGLAQMLYEQLKRNTDL